MRSPRCFFSRMDVAVTLGRDSPMLGVLNDVMLMLAPVRLLSNGIAPALKSDAAGWILDPRIVDGKVRNQIRGCSGVGGGVPGQRQVILRPLDRLFQAPEQLAQVVVALHKINV